MSANDQAPPFVYAAAIAFCYVALAGCVVWLVGDAVVGAVRGEWRR